jgi:hypothetical protein
MNLKSSGTFLWINNAYDLNLHEARFRSVTILRQNRLYDLRVLEVERVHSLIALVDLVSRGTRGRRTAANV